MGKARGKKIPKQLIQPQLNKQKPTQDIRIT